MYSINRIFKKGKSQTIVDRRPCSIHVALNECKSFTDSPFAWKCGRKSSRVNAIVTRHNILDEFLAVLPFVVRNTCSRLCARMSRSHFRFHRNKCIILLFTCKAKNRGWTGNNGVRWLRENAFRFYSTSDHSNMYFILSAEILWLNSEYTLSTFRL